jgi:hypothetical protein
MYAASPRRPCDALGAVLRVLLLALAAPAPAPAQLPPTPVDLRWSAPAECPDAEAFLHATEELVGRTLAIDEHAELRVDGRVTAGEGVYVLQLRFGDGEDPARTLEAAQCDLLVDAGSLVVATRLLDALEGPSAPRVPEPATDPEPSADTEPPPLTTPSVPSTAEPPPPRSGPQHAPRDTPPTHRPPRAAIAVLGGASFGAQPSVAGTLQGDLALLMPSARVVIGARHGFATAARAGEEFGVRVSATSAHALGCWDPVVGRIDVPVCAGIEIGALVGRGDGRAQTSTMSRQLFATIPLQAGIGWAVRPRLALRADLRATVAVDRPGFHVDTPPGTLELFRMGAGSVAGSVGIELRLP